MRERLLHAGGAQAWVEAQPLFLYPAEWMAARLPRLEAEDALAISHFQGKENLLKRLQALKQADFFSRRAAAIACPTLIISAADDLLVPASCSRVLQTAIPGSQLVEMPWGGHACNVTDADTFNTILRDGLSAMLPVAGGDPMNDAINHTACETLFTRARTHNGWLDKPVSDAQLQAVWDLMKMGPTSANCSPARIVFVRSAEGKEKLRPTLSSGNLQKTMQAPVTAIVAWDSAFYDRLPTLFPHGDARSWFTSSPQLAEETAFRNSSLQAAYLIFACRALDLDTGPMSGFDREKVDAAFLPTTAGKATCW